MNIKQKIIDLYNSLKNKRSILNILRSSEYIPYVEFINSYYPMLTDEKYSLGMKIYWLVNGYKDFPECEECGKPNKTHRCGINGYRTNFCSNECAHGDITQKKAEETSIKKYGVSNIGLLEETKKKRTETNLRKYGCINTFQNEEIKERSRQTKLEKYGDPNYTNREKQKETNLEKYGCENPFGNKDIQKKIKDIILKKYGVEHSAQADEIRKKISEKTLRYNVHNSYVNYLLTNPYSKPNFTEEFYLKHRDKTHEFEFVCHKCGKIFKSRVHNGSIRRCPKCYSSVTTSGKEQEIYDFISSFYKNNIERKNRTILNGQELDMFFRKENIAIEFDGLYWHSELNGVDKNYHLNKTNECEKNNVHLIHIFEDEWDKKQNIVKSRIKNMFGLYDKTIFARKCIIKNVDSETSMDFQNANHLQGGIRSSINIGLYYNNELISMMTFCNPRVALGRKDTENEFELLRFCSKLGYHIPGAAGKLLKYFEQNYKPSRIITYADRRWSNGKLYKSIGFIFDHNSKPNYWYLNNGCSERYHRFTFRKSVLKNKLKVYDDSLTEVENMRNNKYTRIFDCGNMMFVKTY